MTPEEILSRAERLGALTPEALKNIVVVGVIAILLTLALVLYYKAKGTSKKDEGEATVLSTAINSLTTTINRQHARDDKAEALIASMTQISNETILATKKTLDSLLEGVNVLTQSLGALKVMGEDVAASKGKLDELIEIADATRRMVEEIRDKQNHEIEQLKKQFEAFKAEHETKENPNA